MESSGQAACEAGLLKAILQESMTEATVIDADTLRILHANQAVVRNLQHSLRALRKLTALDLLQPEDASAFETLVALLKSGRRRRSTLRAHCRRRDGSRYPVEVRLLFIRESGRPVFICIVHDLSHHEATRQALADSASDLRAIVANLPGMAFQVLRKPGAAPALRHVSGQAAQLLGIKAATLRADPERFFRLIHDEDKPGYLEKLAESPGGHLSFNWEGRLLIKAWKDVKWVSVRVSPRTTEQGQVWDGIMLNVTHSKLAEAEVRHSRAQLSAMAAHVETVKEQERLRLAREVHDDLGGNLAAIKIGLSWLARHLPSDDSPLAGRIAYLEKVVDQTFDAVHRIASNLRPAVLELGIVPAIRHQLKQFSHNTDIECHFSAPAGPVPLDPDTSIAVFRIVQEALTNVSKHARASQVRVRLARRPDGFVLTVTDDGHGFAPAPRKDDEHGFGILGMSERAAAFGGTLRRPRPPPGDAGQPAHPARPPRDSADRMTA